MYSFDWNNNKKFGETALSSEKSCNFANKNVVYAKICFSPHIVACCGTHVVNHQTGIADRHLGLSHL